MQPTNCYHGLPPLWQNVHPTILFLQFLCFLAKIIDPHHTLCLLRVFEDLDPVVVMLQQEVKSKKLGRNHVFYNCLKGALEFASKFSNPQEQFCHDEMVQTDVEILEIHTNPGRNRAFQFDWKDWNLPFVPSKTTRDKTKWNRELFMKTKKKANVFICQPVNLLQQKKACIKERQPSVVKHSLTFATLA